jgi:hypothetical protein
VKTNHIFRFLSSDGTTTGTKNAIGDYSGAVMTFWIEGPMTIERMIVSAGDTAGMQAQEYGNIGAALGNGVKLGITDGGVEVVDLMDGEPIKTNAEWGAMCYDVDVKTWGSGAELLVVRWTFSKSGRPLHLETGQKLVITLNDDLRGLTDHRFLIQGYYDNG